MMNCIKNKYFISVIIPCFNVEKYINKCLKSIVNQTIFEELEIICVDDGSTDETLNILYEYKNKYNNIRVFSQNNEGQSSARNLGISHSTCNYINFIDSDDWVNEMFYEYLKNVQIKTNADIVFGKLVTIYDNGNIDEFNSREYLVDNFNCENIDKSKEIIIRDFLNDKISVSPCNKLIKKENIENISFNVGLFNEDMEFTFDLLMKAKKIAKTEESIYYYYQRSGSTTKKTDIRTLDMLIIVDNIKRKVKNEFGTKLDKELIFYELFFSVYLTLLRIRDGVSTEKKELAIKAIMKLENIRYIDIFRESNLSYKKRIIFLFMKKFPKISSNYI